MRSTTQIHKEYTWRAVRRVQINDYAERRATAAAVHAHLRHAQAASARTRRDRMQTRGPAAARHPRLPRRLPRYGRRGADGPVSRRCRQRHCTAATGPAVPVAAVAAAVAVAPAAATAAPAASVRPPHSAAAQQQSAAERSCRSCGLLQSTAGCDQQLQALDKHCL